MPNDKRNKAGEADAETRRKKLREVLDAESGGNPSKPRPKPTLKDAVEDGIEQGSDTLPNGKKRRANQPAKPKKKLVRRFGEKGETEEDLGL